MQFLKTLFWVVLTAVLVIFGSRNWVTVEKIKLWGGLETDVKLPVMILVAFLAGFVPLFVVNKIAGWRHRRTVESLQRALDDSRTQLNALQPADQDGTSPSAPAPQPSLL